MKADLRLTDALTPVKPTLKFDQMTWVSGESCREFHKFSIEYKCDIPAQGLIVLIRYLY